MALGFQNVLRVQETVSGLDLEDGESGQVVGVGIYLVYVIQPFGPLDQFFRNLGKSIMVSSKMSHHYAKDAQWQYLHELQYRRVSARQAFIDSITLSMFLKSCGECLVGNGSSGSMRMIAAIT